MPAYLCVRRNVDRNLRPLHFSSGLDPGDPRGWQQSSTRICRYPLERFHPGRMTAFFFARSILQRGLCRRQGAQPPQPASVAANATFPAIQEVGTSSTVGVDWWPIAVTSPFSKKAQWCSPGATVRW